MGTTVDVWWAWLNQTLGLGSGSSLNTKGEGGADDCGESRELHGCGGLMECMEFVECWCGESLRLEIDGVCVGKEDGCRWRKFFYGNLYRRKDEAAGTEVKVRLS